MTHLCVSRSGPYIVLDIKANAFLHHMVRNITGSLLLVGQGLQPVEWIAEVLAARDRNLAGPTAKAGDSIWWTWITRRSWGCRGCRWAVVAAGLGTGYDQFLVTGPENLWFNDPSFIAIELLSH